MYHSFIHDKDLNRLFHAPQLIGSLYRDMKWVLMHMLLAFALKAALIV